MNKETALGDLGVFLLVFLPLTGFFQYLLIEIGVMPSRAIAIIMWSVGIAAIATMRLRRRPLEELGWNWAPARYHVIAVLLPLFYGTLAYGLAALLGLADFASLSSLESFKASLGLEEPGLVIGFPLALVVTFLGAMPGGFARALGEEIGWRGFATPRMNAVFGFFVGTLITGAVWAAWHFPVLFLGSYNAGGPVLFEAGSFVVMVVAISGPFAWLRMASGSLWPAATFHAAHNLIIQRIFDELTTRGDHAVTMVGEFGVILAGAAVVVCAPFWALGCMRRPSAA